MVSRAVKSKSIEIICPAYCIKAGEVREFRVDRITAIRKTEDFVIKRSLLPTSIHEYLDKLEVGSDYHLKIKLTTCEL